MNLKKMRRELKQPFAMKDIEWRVQQSGIDKKGKPWAMVLAYVTNRAIMNRLDEVFGVGGWRNQYKPLPNSVGEGALCGIGAKIEGEWVTKWDGADNTAIESTKGGLSGSMKRAAVQWSIGRYLYDLDTFWAECQTERPQDAHGWEKAKTKDGTGFYWKPPILPAAYLPQQDIRSGKKKTIKDLVEKTESDIGDYLNFYGVDHLEDLYEDEGSKIIDSLLRKLSKQKEEAGHE